MKFYVASKLENVLPVKKAIAQLTALGDKVTFDWTLDIRHDVATAHLDMHGVLTADYVVGLFKERHTYQGSIAEIGMALAWNKRIYIIGDELDKMVFMLLPNVVKVGSLDELTLLLSVRR